MNILEEYLVKLGFETSEPEFNKARGMLAILEREVTAHAGGMAKRLLEAQATVVGTFTSISAAILGMVDKVAMADQGYRLLGLRMLMTTDSARKMDMITKGLGASLEEIVWDPELHQRAVQMSQDIDRMTGALGPGFEQKMKGIRDIRYEFSRLEVATKFLGMSFVGHLFDKLMPGEAGDKVRNWVTWFEAHIDEIADKLSGYAVPALTKTWDILKAAGGAVREFGVLFQNVVGLLSGDDSLKGTEFSFDKIAKSIEHVGDWMKQFFDWITHAEKLLAHFASATALMFSGKWAAAGKEFKAALAELGAGSGSVIGSVIGAPAGPVGSAVGAVVGGVIGGTKEVVEKNPQAVAVPSAGDAVKHLGSAFLEGLKWLGAGKYTYKTDDAAAPREWHAALRDFGLEGSEPERATQSAKRALSRDDLIAAINAAADQYEVPRSLARAVAQQESGLDPNARSKAGAIGIMQLMPDTAKDLRVDPTDPLQNISGGVHYLAQLLERYHGDEARALAGYNAGPGRADKAESLADLPKETREYIPFVLKIQEELEQATTRSAAQQPVQAQGQASAAAAPDSAIKPSAYAPRAAAPDVLNRDWAPVMAAMQTPQVPAPQYTTNHQATSVDVGGIYITQPGADAHTIQRAVDDGITNALNNRTRFDFTRLSPAF